MKVVNAEFSHCIANINRMSFTETAYPSKKKVGKVTTLFKSGGGEDFGNYQHLTMLSIPRKKKKKQSRSYVNLKSHTYNMFYNRTSGVTERAYLLNHCY